MRRPLPAIALATLLLFSAAPQAQARVPTSEEKIIHDRALDEGERLFEAGQYEAAIAKFLLAYNLNPDEPAHLYNLGQANYRLGRSSNARDYFQRYLRVATTITDQDRDKINGYLADLNARLAREESQREKSVYLPERRRPRPAWRIGLGLTLLAGSAAMLGFGGRFLYLDGRCTTTPAPPSLECDRLYDTFTDGLVLTVAGGLTALGGLILLAIPGPKEPISPGRPSPAATVSLGSVGTGYGLRLAGGF